MTRCRVLVLLAAGHSQSAIAGALGVTKGTVAYHARRVSAPDPRFQRRYLALLCPNCHSQTANWGGRNTKGPTPAPPRSPARRTP